MAYPDGRTIVHLYGDFYAVWDVALAWHNAGRPTINDAGRTYAQQRELYDRWQAGWPGYYPADHPDNAGQPRGHMRFAALDIDWTSDRERRLYAAGLARPFPWENWHWAPDNIYSYPIVYGIPADTKNIDYYLEGEMNSEQEAILRNIEAHLYKGGPDAADPKYVGGAGSIYNMVKAPNFPDIQRSSKTSATKLPADGGIVKVDKIQDDADTNTLVRAVLERLDAIEKRLDASAPKA
jgi:hypothetical protein